MVMDMIEEQTKDYSKGEIFKTLHPWVREWFDSQFDDFTPAQKRSIIDIHKKNNILISSPTGSGKTYLSCVIGKAVCRHGKSVLYIRLADLLEKMAIAGETIGGKLKLLNRLSKYNLLIVDEWASRIVRPDEAHFLFDLVEQRYGNSSTLLCTQHPIKEWHNLLGGDANADSIMDRLVQNARGCPKFCVNSL